MRPSLPACALAALVATALTACAGLPKDFGFNPGSQVGPGAASTPSAPAGASTTPTAVPTTTPLPTPTPTPVPAAPITVALPGEPETLHPLYAQSQAARIVVAALMVGCIGTDETGQPVALGCERVPSEQNGDARWVGQGDDRALEVIFRIRDDWRWTDGQPVTAADAVYAWQTLMTPQALVRDRLTQKVFSVRAASTRVAVVRFMSAGQARAAAAGTLRGDVPFDFFTSLGDYAAYAKQDTPLTDPLYWAALRWLPAHLLRNIKPGDQSRSAFARQPVGDGAFELIEWTPGRRIILRRAKAPFPLQPAGDAPEFTFLFARDEVGAARLVADGDAQVGVPLPRAQAELTLRDARSLAVEAPPSVFEQLTLNAERAPFDDPAVRAAVAVALQNAPEIASAAGGAVEPARPFSLDGDVFRAASPAGAPDADLAAARNLLRGAGWNCTTTPCQRVITATARAPVTRTLSFSLVTSEREPRTLVTQAIQRRLAAAGFAVDVQIFFGLGTASRLFAPASQGGLLANRDFDAALYQLPPISRLSATFGCAAIPNPKTGAGGGNYAGLCDPRLESLIRQAEGGSATLRPGQPNPDVEAALTAVNRASVIIPLYSPRMVVPTRDVRGVRPGPPTPLTWNAWAWSRQKAESPPR